MRTSILRRLVPAATAAALALPAAARAQNAAINNSPATMEFGVDAGLTFGLGKNSFTTGQLPGSRVRVGFFLPNNSRVEIEPAAGLSYAKYEGVAGQTQYNLEIGALYHFRAPEDVTNATRATVAYVRPFLNYTGVTGGGDNVNAVTLGGGLGLKLPIRPNIAARTEANLGYDFRDKAARLGILAGLSFFAFR